MRLLAVTSLLIGLTPAAAPAQPASALVLCRGGPAMGLQRPEPGFLIIRLAVPVEPSGGGEPEPGRCRFAEGAPARAPVTGLEIAGADIGPVEGELASGRIFTLRIAGSGPVVAATLASPGAQSRASR
jgi:hypothetical protein